MKLIHLFVSILFTLGLCPNSVIHAKENAEKQMNEENQKNESRRRIEKLKKLPIFKSLVLFFSKLHQIHVQKKSPQKENQIPQFSMDSTIRNELNRDWDKIVERLIQSDKTILSEEEFTAINHLVYSRINYLSGGNVKLMIMHRAPTYFETEEMKIGERIESIIDQIIVLKSKNNEISDAFEILSNEIGKLLYIKEYRFNYYSESNAARIMRDTGETHFLNKMRTIKLKEYESAQSSVEKQNFKQSLEKLDQIIKMHDRFCLLILEFIQ